MTLQTRTVHTQPKISVTYLIFTAELTHGLACSDSIYIVLIFLLLVHAAIKDLDLELLDLDLDLDSESFSFSGRRSRLDLDLAVAELDTWSVRSLPMYTVLTKLLYASPVGRYSALLPTSTSLTDQNTSDIVARRHHPSVNYSTPQINRYLKQFFF